MKKKMFFMLLSAVLFGNVQLMAQWTRVPATANVRLTNSGDNVAIGLLNANPYKTKIRHGNFGLDLENSASGNDYEFWANNGNWLQVFCNGAWVCYLDCMGVWHVVSDERLKTNIKPMTPVLEKISRLKPSSYQFKNCNTGTQDGFVAQEVMKIFPNLVTHNVEKDRGVDVYALNYDGFGVIAIKGIQELHQTIQEQQQKITTLEDRIAKLEVALNSVSSNNHISSKEIGDVSLEQNEPNPFSQASTIRYKIPAGTKGQIVIYDGSGNLIKSLQTQATGHVQINTYDLKPGTYTYNLMINGTVAASKKMVLIK